MSNTETHRPDDVCIDERSRRAGGSVQWLLESAHVADTHPITPNNELEVLMCGEEAFGRIARDIEAARGSIDVICWGFDPAMELVRSGQAWPRGKTYGGLLEAAAARGVKVRLLVWYEPGLASQRQNNMPGFTGDQRGGYYVESPLTGDEERMRMSMPVSGVSGPKTPEELRNDYCVRWWRKVRSGDQDARGQRIEFKTRRGVASAAARASLDSETDRPGSAAGSFGGVVNEKRLLEEHATHHQKTILIDYAWEGGRDARGYVMGLNSLSSYWDTAEHLFDTSLREVDWARESATARSLPPGTDISRDPYHDYVCRIVGPALQAVHANFAHAWLRASGVRPSDLDGPPPRLAQVPCAYRAQIVRTQPHDGDKTIKDTYFHACEFARNYIYIENQYFFYEAWVRHLKEKRKTFSAWLQGAGRGSGETPLLHLFVVVPWPEDEGMVPRTYDMVKSLGEGDSMREQQAFVDKEIERNARDEARWKSAVAAAAGRSDLPDPDLAPPLLSAIASSAKAVQAPTKNHTTGELEGLGLKVLIGRLTTFNRGKPMPSPELNYRQVYIHSKLMLIDDAFFTLGSANLNQRSMAVDSELNVATDDHVQARALRERVWGQHAGGYLDSAGGAGKPESVAKAFRNWKDVMTRNESSMKSGNEIRGYLVSFRDKRRIDFRHG